MWMDLENIMLSEIRQRKTNTAYITYMCNLLLKKVKTDSIHQLTVKGTLMQSKK